MTEAIQARTEVVTLALIGDPFAAACRIDWNLNTMEGQVWPSVISKA